MEEKSGLSHRVVLNDRNQGSLTGILDVISFDESMIVCIFEGFMDFLSLLTIKGKDLHVSRLTLDKGEIDIEGRPDSLVYSKSEGIKGSSQSFFSRLFK